MIRSRSIGGARGFILDEKEEIREGRKAGRASKTNLSPPPSRSSRSGSVTDNVSVTKEKLVSEPLL